MFALIGSVGTPTGLAAVPILTEAKVPIVGMFTGAQALREPFNRNVFHVRASYFDETERIVQHLTTLGTKKIAVFYQNDAYGKAGLEGVERALAKRQLKLVGTATVERNTADVAKAVETLIPTGARSDCPDQRLQVLRRLHQTGARERLRRAVLQCEFRRLESAGRRTWRRGQGRCHLAGGSLPVRSQFSGRSRLPGENDAGRRQGIRLLQPGGLPQRPGFHRRAQARRPQPHAREPDTTVWKRCATSTSAGSRSTTPPATTWARTSPISPSSGARADSCTDAWHGAVLPKQALNLSRAVQHVEALHFDAHEGAGEARKTRIKAGLRDGPPGRRTGC